MSDDPFTATELEAGARAVGRARHFMDTDGYPSIRIGSAEDEARAVLAAVAPLIAARVRAEEREAIAQAIEPHAGSELVAPAAHRAYRHAAAIARAHHTTPTEEPDDA